MVSSNENSKNLTVAITGANSGIGQTLIPKLVNESEINKIIAIDLQKYETHSPKITVIYGKDADIRNYEAMKTILQDVDVVIHLAFIVIPKEIPKKKIIYDINVGGSKNVFLAAAENNVKKIIHTSSQSVYGHLSDTPEYVKEDSQRLGIKATNFYYAHTKALVEEFLDTEFEKKYPAIIVTRLRSPIITGPHFNEKLKEEPYKITDKTMMSIRRVNGKTRLQLIHEEDLTDALVILSKRNIPGVFNIAGEGILDLEKAMLEKYNIAIKFFPDVIIQCFIRLLRFNKLWSWYGAFRYNSDMETQKIQKELGWMPKYSTEQFLEEIVRLQINDRKKGKNA